MDLEPALRLGAFFGISLAGVIAFEVALNGMGLFNHANLRLPPRLERWLRYLVVTPDMPRIDHAVDGAEHGANYGFKLSLGTAGSAPMCPSRRGATWT